MTLPVIDYSSHLGVAGLDVSFCTSCPCPTATGRILSQGQTDDAGTVMLQVPFFLDATGVPSIPCVQVTSPATPPSIVPTFAYWDFPVTEPVVVVTPTTALSLDVQVLTPAAYAQYQTLNGVIPDGGRGQVAAVIHDCIGSPAPGVQIAINGSPAGVSVLSATDAGTPSGGLIVFDNVPPGSITLTATPVGLGRVAAQVTLTVAAGTLTEVAMFPTPTP